MPIDPDNWHPSTVDEVADIFCNIGIRWWISGGWAIDLFLGRQTREHKDIDIQILRTDQLLVQKNLHDWQLYKTNQPGLAPWPEGEYLDTPVNCVWARPDSDSPWAFEIMLMDTDGDDWIYRRMPTINGKISNLGNKTESGIPYLAPEIQLLYKAVRDYNAKDFADLKSVTPCMTEKSVRWLLQCIQAQYPKGHDWIEYIQQFFSRSATFDSV